MFFFKIVVLKATFDSKPISNFNPLQQKSFLRRSRSQMFFKIGVPKNFANFTGKHLCWSLFLTKLLTFPFFYRTPPVTASGHIREALPNNS